MCQPAENIKAGCPRKEAEGEVGKIAEGLSPEKHYVVSGLFVWSTGIFYNDR